MASPPVPAFAQARPHLMLPLGSLGGLRVPGPISLSGSMVPGGLAAPSGFASPAHGGINVAGQGLAAAQRPGPGQGAPRSPRHTIMSHSSASSKMSSAVAQGAGKHPPLAPSGAKSPAPGGGGGSSVKAKSPQPGAGGGSGGGSVRLSATTPASTGSSTKFAPGGGSKSPPTPVHTRSLGRTSSSALGSASTPSLGTRAASPSTSPFLGGFRLPRTPVKRSGSDESASLSVGKTASEASWLGVRKSVSDASSASLEEPELDDTTAQLRDLCRRIDADGDGYISELELVNAVQRDSGVAACVLPAARLHLAMTNEEVFDEVESVFEAMASGKKRIKYSRFIEHFRSMTDCSVSTREKRIMFDVIDSDGNGAVSKLELVEAMQLNPKVAQFVLPHVNCADAMRDQEVYDAITGVFQAISGGKRRFSYADFSRHFGRQEAKRARPPVAVDRKNVRVFVIGPGFGLKLNPRQGASIVEAGYQVQWYHDLPNPEYPTFNVLPYLDQLKAQIADFKPDVLAAASKGVAYVTGLWKVGYWRGPTLLINAHPTCTQIPKEVSLVLAHGSNDEVYPTSRADLEKLMATGGKNQCFLYYTANSGQLSSGHLSRFGDRHNMESLVQYELLPRLIDATLCPQGPEVHMARTWRERLSEDRLDAEALLGYTPERLRRRWSSHQRRGLDDTKLFDVPRSSEEFQRVAAVFQAAPREPPAYMLSPQATWDRVQILRLQRIENGAQADGSTGPYHTSMRTSLEDQGVDFEPGAHTCWAFHGTDNDALDSIVNDPVAGFQPLVSGSKGATLWGLGTYFAREAKYVADGGFCGPPSADGTRRMLMCLLSTGIPCLGDPQHKGVLPFRQRPHRYHSSVDSLNNPEVYIVQHAGAAHAAYLITFA